MIFYLHDIYTLLLFGCIICISLICINDVKRIFLLLDHPFNQKYLLSYHRVDSIFFHFLVLFVYSTISSFVFSSFLIKGYSNIEISDFILIMFGLLIIYFAKRFINIFIGSLFDFKTTEIDYFQHIINSNLLFSAIVFFPVIFSISYINDGLLIYPHGYKIGLVFIIQYLFLKLIMLNRLNLLNTNSILYIILYLCALEIAPYLVLFKLCSSY